MRKVLFICGVLFILVSATMAEEISHAALIDKLKKGCGLCSVVGCGREGSILKEVSGSGDLLVHCIALNDSGFLQTQEIITENEI